MNKFEPKPLVKEFGLTQDQVNKIDNWLFSEVFPVLVAAEKKESQRLTVADILTLNFFPKPRAYNVYQHYCWLSNKPAVYKLEYIFGDTEIGQVAGARECFSGMEINVTDYDSW